MLTLNKIVDPTMPAVCTVTLSYEQRQRSNLRVTLSNGDDAGIALPRGNPMSPGDRLTSTDGLIVEVVPMPESVSFARVDDAVLLSRACYHLGNRHVKVQIESGQLSYLHDHVLDDMLETLGIRVESRMRPFEPEQGAYHGGHSHGDDHQHGSSQDNLFDNTTRQSHEH